MSASCSPFIVDRNGKRWPNLRYVRGQCEDHWLPQGSWIDGPMRWESEKRPVPVTKPPVVSLRGLPSGFTPSCDLPSPTGLAPYGAAGAPATPRRRTAGALNGLWGGWVGCAVSRAIGAGDAVSLALTLGGAYFVSKTFGG